MFLQGPYFSEEGALGLPKAKSGWEHCIYTSKYKELKKKFYTKMNIIQKPLKSQM